MYPQFACVMGIFFGGPRRSDVLGSPHPWGDECQRVQRPRVRPDLELVWGRTGTGGGQIVSDQPAVKHYYINRNLLHLKSDKVLWKERKEGDDKKRILIVPRDLRREILCLCHEVPAAGHQGIEGTKARPREHFFFDIE